VRLGFSAFFCSGWLPWAGHSFVVLLLQPPVDQPPACHIVGAAERCTKCPGTALLPCCNCWPALLKHACLGLLLDGLAPTVIDWRCPCRDPSRLASLALTLRLLAQLLWARAGRDAAVAAHDAGALPLLLRAVLMGTKLLAASHADDQWDVLAGDSIDAAAAGEGRRAALEFLGAAAAAMSVFMQHLRL
jgi:hypothetical protein